MNFRKWWLRATSLPVLLVLASWSSYANPTWASGVFFGIIATGCGISLVDWYFDRQMKKAKGE
jgi:hypothetical protein